ncbi:putative cytosolic iron-sulfur protein assembly protein 1 [Fasciola hepatica]|uniref:Probable cytosolic iron-sulfur protein assembly protein CIAO1 homolog n=1 Tax=Fasciola hepatica TaxID=6192 RepID=A0A4E0RFT0_FASHE|nr:putative cytosolic iron-sulfur protein assembly protein 1 [Fasciola hepatica]
MMLSKQLASVKASSSRVWCVTWSHKGDILGSCGEDKSIVLWTVAADGVWDRNLVVPNSHSRAVRRLSWSPCDNYLASASFDTTIIIWKIIRNDGSVDAEALATLEGHTSEVKCVSWSPSGHLLASCGRDKSVWLWEFDDEEDVQCVSVLQPHSQDVKCVCWHPFDEMLVSSSYDDTINLYKEEMDDWTLAVTLNGHSSTVWKVEFSPCGKILASCSTDCTVKLWTVRAEADKFKGASWFCLSTLAGHHTDVVFDLAWSHDGEYLASVGADNRLCIFRFSSPILTTVAGQPQLSEIPTLWCHIPMAHTEDINSVCWFPIAAQPTGSDSLDYTTRKILCTAGDDGLIRFWAVPSCDPMNSLELAVD